MSKHTPGPWTAHNYPDLISTHMLNIWGPESRCYYVQADSVRSICAVNGPCGVIPAEEVDANTHLIAAAPDLLTAAKMALNDRMYKDWPEIADALVAAIAKAEGRS